MTLALDPPIAVGAVRIAALCETGIKTHAWPVGGAVSASKTPFAILVRKGRSVEAFGLDGAPLDLAALEEHCPGLKREMLKAD